MFVVVGGDDVSDPYKLTVAIRGSGSVWLLTHPSRTER